MLRKSWITCASLGLAAIALTAATVRSERIVRGPAPIPGGNPLHAYGAAPAQAEVLPEDAAEAIREFERERVRIEAEVETKLAPKRAEMIAKLQALQDTYTKAAKLDEAVAIRNRIRVLKLQAENAVADPGNVVGYRDRIGQTFAFEVVGSTHGSVWGSDVYTDDSNIATAAVHAGLLREGERGIVKVVIMPPAGAYVGSIRNGIESSNYGAWEGSYGFLK